MDTLFTDQWPLSADITCHNDKVQQADRSAQYDSPGQRLMSCKQENTRKKENQRQCAEKNPADIFVKGTHQATGKRVRNILQSDEFINRFLQ